MTPAQIVARDKIEFLELIKSKIPTAKHWIKGFDNIFQYDGTQCYCLNGAVNAVKNDYLFAGRDKNAITLLEYWVIADLTTTFSKFKHYCIIDENFRNYIVRYNDYPNTTYEDIVKVIDLTIAKIRRSLPPQSLTETNDEEGKGKA